MLSAKQWQVMLLKLTKIASGHRASRQEGTVRLRAHRLEDWQQATKNDTN
jgi:5-carboxymethyl-2-hydroxymuconate isomerase